MSVAARAPSVARPKERATGRTLALPLARVDVWELALAIGFGLLVVAYAALIRPFDAPDENSHYEYAVRMAELGGVPAHGDRSAALYERVRKDMLTRRTGLMVTAPDGSRQLGFNLELGRQPPLYYLFPAILSQISTSDLGVQIRLMRLASIAMGLCVVAVGIAAGRVAFPRNPFASLALPALAVLTPGFVFTTASVTNDNLANLGGAIAFLALVTVVARGLDRRALALLAIGLVVGLAGKRTALALLPTSLIVLYLIVGARMASRRLAGLVLLLPIAIVATTPLWALVESPRAVGWQAARAGLASRSPEALLGDASLLVATDSPDATGELRQVLSAADVEAARPGLTVGAWVRSLDGSTSTARIVVDQDTGSASVSSPVDGTWRFVRTVYQPKGDGPTRVTLVAAPGGSGALFDGVVVASGERAGVPSVDDAVGRTGSWGGRPFANMLANGSGEQAERTVRPSLSRVADALGVPDPVLIALLSPSVLPPPLILQRLEFTFETYFGRFGWLTVPMPDPIYWLALAIGAAAVLGLGVSIAERRHLPLVGLCALSVLMAVGVAVGPFLVGAMGHELPQGRYLYPIALPFSCLLAIGLSRWVPTDRRRAAAAAIVLGCVGLNVVALLTTLLPRFWATA